MSIACDSSLTLIGVRVGGVSEKKRPIDGCTVSLVLPAIMCSSRTRSSPGSSVHAVSDGSITGTLPGVQPYTFCT